MTEARAQNELDPKSRNLMFLIVIALLTPFFLSILSTLPFLIQVPLTALLGYSLCHLAFNTFKSWKPHQQEVNGNGAQQQNGLLINDQSFQTFLVGSCRYAVRYTKQFFNSVFNSIGDALQDDNLYPAAPDQTTPDSPRKRTTSETSSDTPSQERSEKVDSNHPFTGGKSFNDFYANPPAQQRP